MGRWYQLLIRCCVKSVKSVFDRFNLCLLLSNANRLLTAPEEKKGHLVPHGEKQQLHVWSAINMFTLWLMTVAITTSLHEHEAMFELLHCCDCNMLTTIFLNTWHDSWKSQLIPRRQSLKMAVSRYLVNSHCLLSSSMHALQCRASVPHFAH